ncbi:MAG TPA: ABC transporter substrate-binding protein, partial [Thermomicrobiales bacterium]|nr:ABC transporter substrate-binding protein [Thermomicrobiales bacterium]
MLDHLTRRHLLGSLLLGVVLLLAGCSGPDETAPTPTPATTPATTDPVPTTAGEQPTPTPGSTATV